MAPSDTLYRYLQGFANADQGWAPPRSTHDPRMAWWRALPWSADQVLPWSKLCNALPQLTLPQQAGISKSELYRQRVLRGMKHDVSSEQYVGHQLQDLGALQLHFPHHPYVSIPVLSTPNRADFEHLVRALAHRSEPVRIECGVHAQCVSNLIHWGLIRSLGPEQRSDLIILHEAPYGSVHAKHGPVGFDEEQWLRASFSLRLEHELTHLTTKQQLGEMRINLLDELISDAMGQLVALGGFSANLFLRCLHYRWRTYVPNLDSDEARHVLRLVQARAHELERAISAWSGDDAIAARAQLLAWLCRLRLDKPICNVAPPPAPAIQETSVP